MLSTKKWQPRLFFFYRPVSRSWKGAEAVATFLLCVFVFMAADAVNKRSGVCLADARFRVTFCSGFRNQGRVNLKPNPGVCWGQRKDQLWGLGKDLTFRGRSCSGDMHKITSKFLLQKRTVWCPWSLSLAFISLSIHTTGFKIQKTYKKKIDIASQRYT